MSFMLKKPRTLPPPVIRTERVPVKKTTTTTTPAKTSRTTAQPRSNPGSNSVRPFKKSSTRTPDSGSDVSPRRKLIQRKRTVAQRLESDSEEDGNSSTSGFELVRPNKKVKVNKDRKVDMSRDLLPTSKFTSVDQSKLVHASLIASLRDKKFVPAFGAAPEDVHVELQYPGGVRKEQYELVYAKSEFDPVEEILDVVKDFANFFVTSEHAEAFHGPDNGIIRRMERAKNLKSMEGFKDALDTYNSTVGSLSKQGILKDKIAKSHMLTYDIVRRIMKQCYDRAVSPKIDLLKKYENGTDFIYGELKTVFVHNILVESGITSDQVFVDLGSGVANVVVQAALQIGCESWGCEIMENACLLAKAQKQEFEARCRLWGIAPGAVHLEQGDFMINDNIRNALKRADVVLVNNEVFTPTLNNDLVNLFLDLKDGCQIVSLKSFLPQNHRITSYNLNNPVNLLEVEQKSYASGSVSWKDEGGNYFVAKKDSTRLRSYEHLS